MVSVVQPGIATCPAPRPRVIFASAATRMISVMFAWSSRPPLSAVAAMFAGAFTPADATRMSAWLAPQFTASVTVVKL